MWPQTKRKTSEELRGFVDLLSQISKKQKGQDISPIYKDDYSNVAFVLVAKPKNMVQDDHQLYVQEAKPYIDYIKNAIHRDTDTFYILAKSHRAIKVANLVVGRLRNRDLVEETNRYQGRSNERPPLATLCIRLHTNHKALHRY